MERNRKAGQNPPRVVAPTGEEEEVAVAVAVVVVVVVVAAAVVIVVVVVSSHKRLGLPRGLYLSGSLPKHYAFLSSMRAILLSPCLKNSGYSVCYMYNKTLR